MWSVASKGRHHVATNAKMDKAGPLTADELRRIDAYCSVPGHADLGMRGVVVVE